MRVAPIVITVVLLAQPPGPPPMLPECGGRPAFPKPRGCDVASDTRVAGYGLAER